MWASHGAVDPRALLGLAMGAEDDLDTRPSHHDGHDDHEHDDFDTCLITLDGPQDREALLAKCQEAVAEFGLYRLKGFAHIADSQMRLAIQGVGPRFTASFDRDWKADERPLTRLVAIGQHGLTPPLSKTSFDLHN